MVFAKFIMQINCLKQNTLVIIIKNWNFDDPFDNFVLKYTTLYFELTSLVIIISCTMSITVLNH